MNHIHSEKEGHCHCGEDHSCECGKDHCECKDEGAVCTCSDTTCGHCK